ncbi:regenerating islet-derived protein 4-like [Bacillus rossius redtenbacheri]|uniref:regenerating islet-derived protein 4-like n=1 Tax=Bacillus rossius redtenbacheri TaxID=93214 RepID=UPI002FDEE60F
MRLLTAILLWCLASGTADGSRRRYNCPARFVRISNGCYLFSTTMETWQDAFFACRAAGADLAAMETGWEDSNIRSYLNRPELAHLERWIGGIYNWITRRWVWGSDGHHLLYQGFSRVSLTANHKWHCIIMDPIKFYKWSTRLCTVKKHYICETFLMTV